MLFVKNLNKLQYFTLYAYVCHKTLSTLLLSLLTSMSYRHTIPLHFSLYHKQIIIGKHHTFKYKAEIYSNSYSLIAAQLLTESKYFCSLYYMLMGSGSLRLSPKLAILYSKAMLVTFPGS